MDREENVCETCEIPEEVMAEYKKFKTARSQTTDVMFLKINVKQLRVEIEDVMTDVNLEDIPEELPECVPRFLVINYRQTHADGRLSFPLVFVFFCPPGIKPELNILYASTKQRLALMMHILKDYELKDKEEFNEEWLKKKLGIFG